MVLLFCGEGCYDIIAGTFRAFSSVRKDIVSAHVSSKSNRNNHTYKGRNPIEGYQFSEFRLTNDKRRRGHKGKVRRGFVEDAFS